MAFLLPASSLTVPSFICLLAKDLQGFVFRRVAVDLRAYCRKSCGRAGIFYIPPAQGRTSDLKAEGFHEGKQLFAKVCLVQESVGVHQPFSDCGRLSRIRSRHYFTGHCKEALDRRSERATRTGDLSRLAWVFLFSWGWVTASFDWSLKLPETRSLQFSLAKTGWLLGSS